ncbi:hypothetical protein [Nocardia sp. AG03]|uniref:hypothetical protein n=1 Tax=Nocardia sp. AG03 TaxID=3025312 RepID=UPI0024183811|nr:hypothetical protein [Nocardia sp. AG03]
MLKSYNELSRWYSALEPEADPATSARGGTADPAADGDDGPARYSQRPARVPSDDPSAEPTELDGRTADDDSVDPDDATPREPKPDAVRAPEDDAAVGAEPDRHTVEPPVAKPAVAGDPAPDSRAESAPVWGRPAGFPDDETPRRTVGYPERDFRNQDVPAYRPEPESAPEPPLELAARRSEFTGGWSDWVAPGPEDDYDAELVQFPWPEAAADDYDEAHVLAPSGSLRATRARNRTWIVLAVSVLVLVLAATGVLFLLFGRGEEESTGRHAAPLHFTAGQLLADTPLGDCPTERTGSVVRSAEAGGTDSGPDAVLAFQYAYYVTRSGIEARAVVAPDAEVAPAAVIQRGIDSIPVGTTHCVRITTVADDRFTVEVTEFRPAGAPATYTKQSVRTALVGERTLITGIAAG